MADPAFETHLERLFDRPPSLEGAEAFARQVETRLDRGWGLRQVLIGSAGLAGGMVGVFQLLRSGAVPRFETLSNQSAQAFTQGVERALGEGVSLSALPLGGEAVWMAAALGVMALAFAITRASQEF